MEEMYSDYLDGNDSCKPDVISFNTVLNVWSKTKYRAAPERAEAIFWSACHNYMPRILESKRKLSTRKPEQLFTFNNYEQEIPTAAKDGNPELTESLFLQMIQEYTENDTGEEPSHGLLSVILNAWTKQPRSKMKAAPE